MEYREPSKTDARNKGLLAKGRRMGDVPWSRMEGWLSRSSGRGAWLSPAKPYGPSTSRFRTLATPDEKQQRIRRPARTDNPALCECRSRLESHTSSIEQPACPSVPLPVLP